MSFHIWTTVNLKDIAQIAQIPFFLFKRVIFEKKMQEGRPYSCYEIEKLSRINEKLGGQVVPTEAKIEAALLPVT